MEESALTTRAAGDDSVGTFLTGVLREGQIMGRFFGTFDFFLYPGTEKGTSNLKTHGEMAYIREGQSRWGEILFYYDEESGFIRKGQDHWGEILFYYDRESGYVREGQSHWGEILFYYDRESGYVREGQNHWGEILFYIDDYGYIRKGQSHWGDIVACITD